MCQSFYERIVFLVQKYIIDAFSLFVLNFFFFSTNTIHILELPIEELQI